MTFFNIKFHFNDHFLIDHNHLIYCFVSYLLSHFIFSKEFSYLCLQSILFCYYILFFPLLSIDLYLLLHLLSFLDIFQLLLIVLQVEFHLISFFVWIIHYYLDLLLYSLFYFLTALLRALLRALIYYLMKE